MRIKDGKGRTAERVYMICATVLTLGVIVYGVWLVKDLVQKSNDAFSISPNGSGTAPTFNFTKYEQLMGPINPASATAATTTKPVAVPAKTVPASSTTATASSTKK